MADKNDNGGIGSALRTGVTAAPAIAGAGVTASRIRSAWEEIAAVADSGQIQQTQESVRRFASEYISEDPLSRQPSSKAWKTASYVAEINQLAETSQLSVSQIREIVQRIAQKADPTGGMPLEITKRLATVGNPQEAFSALNLYLSGTNSIYTRRAAKMMADDLTTMSQRVAAGLPVDTVAWTGKIPRIKSTLKGPADWEKSLGSKMSRDLERIQKLTGADIGVSILKRKDVLGEELQIVLSGGNIPGATADRSGEIRLKIPRVIKGQYAIESGPLAGMGTVIKSGSTQQSKRIAGVYGLIENRMLVESFNHEEWMMRRAAEEVIPHIMNSKRLSRREVARITREFESKMRETAEWVHSVKGFEATEEYIKSRAPMMRLYEAASEISPRTPASALQYAEKYASVDVPTLAGLVERGGLDLPGGEVLPLFPGPGPTQAAGGVALLTDPRKGVGLMPESFPSARRPLQAIRANWSPTEAAKKAMLANPVNTDFMWAARETGVASPMLKAAFVSSKYQHMLEGTGVHAEGQFLLAQRRAAELAVDEITQLKIDASKIGPDLADIIDLKSGAHWDINRQIKEGTFLGYSPSGARVVAPEDMTLLHATAFGDKEEGTFLRLVGTRKLENINFAKYFGIKATAALKEDEQLAAVLESLGLTLPPGARPTMEKIVSGTKAINREKFRNLSEDLMRGEDPEELADIYGKNRKVRAKKARMINAGVDAIFTVDELKKNRSLHYNQMFTALWDFNRARMNTGHQMSPDIKAFQSDPLSFIERIRGVAEGLPAVERDIYKMQQIANLARESRLTPEEMGGVFGAVPEAMEDIGGIKTLGNLNKAEIRAIENGTAVGYTQLFFGGAGRETGAGTRASLEPRTMELLQGPAWGALGPQVQEDLMKRMVITYPERLFEQKELMTSLSSMQNLGTRSGAISPEKMLEAAGKGLLPAAGTNMRIAGVGDIYIPGTSTIRQLASYQTPSGKVIDMPLAHSYRDLVETAKAYESRNVTREVLEKKISEVASLTGQATLGTITKKGGLLRNKIPGSAYLRAEDITVGMQELTADVGISPGMGKRMFGEMEKMGIYGAEELASMRERFEKGEAIAGLIQRDPSIGPYSVQAVTIQQMKGAGKAAIFREQRYKAFAAPGLFEDLASGKEFLAQAKAAFAAGKGSDIRLSPLVGMSGDFDADNVSLMFSGPQLEEALRRKAGNTLEYENYIIRQQMLKAKAASAIVDAGTEMGGSIYSLSVTGGKDIGRLSVKLQEYRAGILMGAGGLSEKEGLNALSLLEWLEQVPISSKHIEKGKESSVLSLLGDIDTALARKDAAGIATAVDLVMGGAKEANRAALFEGATVALQSSTGGVRVARLEGMELIETAQNIIKARHAMDASAEGKIVTSRIRQMFFDKGPRIRAEEAFDILGPEFAKKSIFGSLIQAGQASQQGLGSELTSRALAAKNRMAAIGKGMLEHARPLAMGIGISMGLSLILSEPPRVLGPGATVPPQPNMRSGSGGANAENIHPQDITHGSPSAPSPSSFGQTARVGSGDGFNVNIRGRTNIKVDYNSLNTQIRQITGKNTRTSTNVRDMRNSLTPQKLSGILRG